MSVKLSVLFRERSPPRVVGGGNKKKKRQKQGGDDNQSTRTVGLLCLRESVNMPGLRWIRSNLDEVVQEERTKFSTYADRMEEGDGTRLVVYAPTGHGKGRVYADGASSLQSFSKKIRATLARGIYHDIDIANAHPFILRGICERNNWPCPKLIHYIENRETIFKSIMGAYDCARGNAKVLMLSLMYGGGISAWKERGNFVESGSGMPQFVSEYTLELESIAAKIFVTYEDIPVATTKRPHFSRMSLLIQDVENGIVMEMGKFFKLNGYEPGVYLFDGLMIYRKERGTLGPLDRTVLVSCQTHLKEVVGWDVSLEEKPIEEGFAIF